MTIQRAEDSSDNSSEADRESDSSHNDGQSESRSEDHNDDQSVSQSDDQSDDHSEDQSDDQSEDQSDAQSDADSVEQSGPEPIFNYMDLPSELQLQVFEQLTDLLTIRALSLACKTTNALYKRNEQKINDTLMRYYVDEIGAYYDFLSTLHIDPEAVRRPGSAGWKNLVAEKAADWEKTELAMQVIRHLPVIKTGDIHTHQDTYHNIDFHSVVIDRSRWRSDEEHLEESTEEWVAECNEELEFEHIVAIAHGYESGGVILILDTLRGVLHEEIVRDDQGDVLPVHEYLESRRQKLIICDQVFVPGHDPIECPDEVYEYDEQEAREVEESGEPSLPKEWFGHAEDFRWVRHLYMKHGWPSADWKKAEGLKAIRSYAERREQEYDG